jgi:hypothetical protein
VGKLRGVRFVKYNGKYLYNVLLKKHSNMVVNNMNVETLNPTNVVSKLYLNDYNIADKLKLIMKINDLSKNTNDNRMSINYIKTNYTVHRFNPRYNNIVFTRRNNHGHNYSGLRINVAPPSALVNGSNDVENGANADNTPNPNHVVNAAVNVVNKPTPNHAHTHTHTHPHNKPVANQTAAIAKHTKTLKNLIRLRSFWTHRNPHNKDVNANRYFNRRRW